MEGEYNPNSLPVEFVNKRFDQFYSLLVLFSLTSQRKPCQGLEKPKIVLANITVRELCQMLGASTIFCNRAAPGLTDNLKRGQYPEGGVR